ncbi:MAG: hypothetical protein AAGJ51_02890 [Pseudomonadota bacterium]
MVLNKIFAAFVVATLSANAAFAGTCTPSDRDAGVQDVDVNIKVKNDTDEIITVSIWKGTATEKKTLFSDEVAVPIDGKEGKTDKNVTSAFFYFSAKRPGSETEALCTFWAYMGWEASMEVKTNVAYIEDFSCPQSGDFSISCEKGYDGNKNRWNVTYSLE